MKSKIFITLAVTAFVSTGCFSKGGGIGTPTPAPNVVQPQQDTKITQNPSTDQKLDSSTQPTAPATKPVNQSPSPTNPTVDFSSYEGEWRKSSGLTIFLHFTTPTDATLDLNYVSPPPAYDITQGKTDAPIHFSSDGVASYSFKDNRENTQSGTIHLQNGKILIDHSGNYVEFLRNDAFHNIEQLARLWEGKALENTVYTYANSPTELQVLVQHTQKDRSILSIHGTIKLDGSQTYTMPFNNVQAPGGIIQDVGTVTLKFGDQLIVTTKIAVPDGHSKVHFPEETEVYIHG